MKSTAPIIDGVISTRTHVDGNQKVIQQVLRCGVLGCEGELAVNVTKTLKPGNIVLNMARRRGWHIEGDGRKVCICPAHKEERKERKMDLKPPVELPAANLSLVGLEQSLKLPTDAARAQRRKVFHEIEGCYAQGRYVEGFSDEIIAKKLLVAVGMVTEVREMNFGPAGPDPRIAELRKLIEGLETRVGQIEDAALAVVDQAEKKAVELRRDIASLKDRIHKLEGSL